MEHSASASDSVSSGDDGGHGAVKMSTFTKQQQQQQQQQQQPPPPPYGFDYGDDYDDDDDRSDMSSKLSDDDDDNDDDSLANSDTPNNNNIPAAAPSFEVAEVVSMEQAPAVMMMVAEPAVVAEPVIAVVQQQARPELHINGDDNDSSSVPSVVTSPKRDYWNFSPASAVQQQRAGVAVASAASDSNNNNSSSLKPAVGGGGGGGGSSSAAKRKWGLAKKASMMVVGQRRAGSAAPRRGWHLTKKRAASPGFAAAAASGSSPRPPQPPPTGIFAAVAWLGNSNNDNNASAGGGAANGNNNGGDNDNDDDDDDDDEVIEDEEVDEYEEVPDDALICVDVDVAVEAEEEYQQQLALEHMEAERLEQEKAAEEAARAEELRALNEEKLIIAHLAAKREQEELMMSMRSDVWQQQDRDRVWTRADQLDYIQIQQAEIIPLLGDMVAQVESMANADAEAEARALDDQLVVVDCMRDMLSNLCDEYNEPRPGERSFRIKNGFAGLHNDDDDDDRKHETDSASSSTSDYDDDDDDDDDGDDPNQPPLLNSSSAIRRPRDAAAKKTKKKNKKKKQQKESSLEQINEMAAVASGGGGGEVSDSEQQERRPRRRHRREATSNFSLHLFKVNVTATLKEAHTAWSTATVRTGAQFVRFADEMVQLLFDAKYQYDAITTQALIDRVVDDELLPPLEDEFMELTDGWEDFNANVVWKTSMFLEWMQGLMMDLVDEEQFTSDLRPLDSVFMCMIEAMIELPGNSVCMEVLDELCDLVEVMDGLMGGVEASVQQDIITDRIVAQVLQEQIDVITVVDEIVQVTDALNSHIRLPLPPIKTKSTTVTVGGMVVTVTKDDEDGGDDDEEEDGADDEEKKALLHTPLPPSMMLDNHHHPQPQEQKRRRRRRQRDDDDDDEEEEEEEDISDLHLDAYDDDEEEEEEEHVGLRHEGRMDTVNHATNILTPPAWRVFPNDIACPVNPHLLTGSIIPPSPRVGDGDLSVSESDADEDLDHVMVDDMSVAPNRNLRSLVDLFEHLGLPIEWALDMQSRGVDVLALYEMSKSEMREQVPNKQLRKKLQTYLTTQRDDFERARQYNNANDQRSTVRVSELPDTVADLLFMLNMPSEVLSMFEAEGIQMIQLPQLNKQQWMRLIPNEQHRVQMQTFVTTNQAVFKSSQKLLQQQAIEDRQLERLRTHREYAEWFRLVAHERRLARRAPPQLDVWGWDEEQQRMASVRANIIDQSLHEVHLAPDRFTNKEKCITEEQWETALRAAERGHADVGAVEFITNDVSEQLHMSINTSYHHLKDSIDTHRKRRWNEPQAGERGFLMSQSRYLAQLAAKRKAEEDANASNAPTETTTDTSNDYVYRPYLVEKTGTGSDSDAEGAGEGRGRGGSRNRTGGNKPIRARALRKPRGSRTAGRACYRTDADCNIM